MSDALYERLVGSAWHKVSRALQLAHVQNAELHGHGKFQIRRGTNPLARLVAWALRLPFQAESIDVRLQVTPFDQGERWARSFGTRLIVSLQQEAPGHLLAERFGVLEFCFQLEPTVESLTYIQREAAICLGPMRQRIPAWLAPQVTAVEKATDTDECTYIRVRVTLPIIGLLIAYEGKLYIEDGQP